MIAAIDRKLWRNLLAMKGQAIAIVLIIACGVASFVTMVTAHRGLRTSRDTYYARYRMADVWAPLKRAPRSVLHDLEEVEGVRRVEGRIVFDVTLDLPEVDQPVSGRVLSVPDRRRRAINDLHMVDGSWFEGDGTREVIVSESFAAVHGLKVGDSLRVVMNNKKEALRVVALAMSPEFVYLIRGAGDILPDAKHFTVLWLSQTFAESVFDYKDSCNEFLALLDRDADRREVLAQFDAKLDRYGGFMAYERKDQSSHSYLKSEIDGLKASAQMIPVIYLGVAAFVLNMLMGRLVRTQRTQVALMRALGYGTGELVAHYLKLSLLVGLLGAMVGIGLGIWFARGLVGIYQDFFSLPVLDFGADYFAIGIGVAVSFGFAILGTLGALRQVVALTPSEGMRPEAPRSFERTIFERIGFFWRRLGFASRMILRNVARTKLRAAVTVTGVTLSCAIVVLGFFGNNAVEELLDFQFRLSERHDLKVAFHLERGRSALYEMRRVAGVRTAEPELTVGVKLVNGWRSKRTGIVGLTSEPTLNALLDRDKRTVAMPRAGLLLSSKLAEMLGLRVGDEVAVEVLTGRKQHFTAPVEAIVEDYLGTFAYADIDRLSRWVGEERALTGARLAIDPDRAAALGKELKELPAVASVSFREHTLQAFADTVGESQGIQNAVLMLFAGVITFGVVYNAARIALAERQREFGSMRVLGFTSREVAAVLVGENLLLVTLGLLPGIGLGYFFCWLLTKLYDTELFRFPFVVRAETMLLTAGCVMGFALIANLVVMRTLKSLDIVEVLKERE